MATSELQFVKEIKDSVRQTMGGKARKLADRQGGTLDMSICTPDHGQFWLELKFLVAPKRPDTLLELNLSELQSRFIKEEIRCGGRAGWALCVKYGPRLWRYWVGIDPRVRYISQSAPALCARKTGETLNTRRIADLITSEAWHEDMPLPEGMYVNRP